MKKKLLAVFLCFSIINSLLIPLDIGAISSHNPVTVMKDGAKVSKISVPENEERLLSGEVLGIDALSYNWQIKIVNTDIWVNIDGKDSRECPVSYALVGSMLIKRTELICAFV